MPTIDRYSPISCAASSLIASRFSQTTVYPRLVWPLSPKQIIPELCLSAENDQKNKLTKLIQNAVSSQIVSAIVDSFRTPPYERPAKNTFGRFLWSSCGAFFSLLFAPPIFLY